MTGADFLRFRKAMAVQMGLDEIMLSERKTAALLDCSRYQVQKWSSYGAPLYVAYACRAIANSMTPWGHQPKTSKETAQ